jgi:hypothetical protein
MRIKVVNSSTDINGDLLPAEMVGKEYDVVKKDTGGVWVREGKFETLVQYGEMEIVELSEELTNVYDHYLKTIQKDKFNDQLRSMGHDHLL